LQHQHGSHAALIFFDFAERAASASRKSRWPLAGGLEAARAFLYAAASFPRSRAKEFPPEKIPCKNAALVGPIFLFPRFAWDR
jgi:hypothetical protein